MSAARPDPLARWRAARAAQGAGTVATVATNENLVATPGKAQETAIVATVATVASENSNECTERVARDAWGLSAADREKATARLSVAPVPSVGETPADPEPMDHDAAERSAMVAHYAASADSIIYRPDRPDVLRDGLRTSALQRPTAWSDPSLIPPPGAWCSCCGRFDRKGGRWWTSAPAPDGWACVTCRPPDHLKSNDVEIVTT